MRTLALYLSAGAAYVGLGVLFPPLLYAWPVGVGFLLLWVLLVPLLGRLAR